MSINGLNYTYCPCLLISPGATGGDYHNVGLMLVLYWTETWWSGVDNERVKEGKRLIFPGLHSQLLRSRESARNREIEREIDERQTDRHGDQSSDGAKVF